VLEEAGQSVEEDLRKMASDAARKRMLGEERKAHRDV
jgi:hypothetical protein